MLTPGPDHPITVEPAKRRWRAIYSGHVIADTNDALVLREADYPQVVYFPRGDVSMEYLSRTERTSHCPYKGDAAYYTILMDGRFAENAVWTYEAPFPAMETIAERLAFYTDQVEVYEVDDAAVNHHPHAANPDEVVQHTDSGDGRAQREHWAPNVETPTLEEDGLR
ncbi:MAG: DUF427 domain-containing protein [Phenylobacterium sp.]